MSKVSYLNMVIKEELFQRSENTQYIFINATKFINGSKLKHYWKKDKNYNLIANYLLAQCSRTFKLTVHK